MSKRFLNFWGIFFSSLLLFLFRIQNISVYIFDELHYVGAAKLILSEAQIANIEHPPLGKYLMAFSMAFLGDNGLAWRLPGVILGALAVGVIYLISEELFNDSKTSLFATILTLSNFWLFVESRTALLEIYMIAFAIYASYFFIRYYKTRQFKWYFMAAIFCALSMASKWSGAFVLLPVWLITIDLRHKKHLIFFIFLTCYFYFVAFVPYLFMHSYKNWQWTDIFYEMPLEMYRLLKSVTASHPYESKWYTWPFMTRPIWYHFASDPDFSQKIQGVIALINPLQIIISLMAILYFLIIKIKYFYHHHKIQLNLSFGLLIFIFISLLMWGIVGRRLTFFYYYFATATVYSFLIPLFLKELFITEKRISISFLIVGILSLSFFYYFYPILAGAPIPGGDYFVKWMWFQSWI